MELINRTGWRSDDLRSFFYACCKRAGYDTKRRVEVITSRSPWRVRGLASVGGRWIKMLLPDEPFELKLMAQVFIHELDHNAGLNHEDMVKSYNIDASWANSLMLRKKEPKAKPKRDIIKERSDHAEKMLQAWERKLNLAKTKQKLWAGKAAYYSKALAQRAQTEQPTEVRK